MDVNFKCVIKCAAFSVIVTFVLIMILACISYLSGVSESIITTGVYISIVAGVVLGTFAVSKAAANKVLIHAMLVCAIFAACIILVSLLLNRGISFNVRFFVVIAGIFASGFLGCLAGK